MRVTILKKAMRLQSRPLRASKVAYEGEDTVLTLHAARVRAGPHHGTVSAQRQPCCKCLLSDEVDQAAYATVKDYIDSAAAGAPHG